MVAFLNPQTHLSFCSGTVCYMDFNGFQKFFTDLQNVTRRFEIIEKDNAKLQKTVCKLKQSNAELKQSNADLKKSNGVMHQTIEKLVKDVENLQEQKSEKHFQTILEAITGGSHLTIPGIGRTDITTSDMHIEIKHWLKYHEVPGQLDKYNHAVPRSKLCVYLFGSKPKKDKSVKAIEEFFKRHRIEMFSFQDNDEIVQHTVIEGEGEGEGDKNADNLVQSFLNNHLSPLEGSSVHVHQIAESYNRYLADKLVKFKVDTRWMKKKLKHSPFEINNKRRSANCCGAVTVSIDNCCLLEYRSKTSKSSSMSAE